jgi:ABC-type methionine transport system permease subunit
MRFLTGLFVDIAHKKDRLWIVFWFGGVAGIWMWDVLFLNTPALDQIEKAFVNTMVSSILVAMLSLVASWILALTLHFTEEKRALHLSLNFLINVIRSVPQIIGVLVCYAVITWFIERDRLESESWKIFWMAMAISAFVFLELLDLLQERIRHFKRSDFYSAMLVCGIRESRIVQYDILYKNSARYITNKLIGIFGIAIFLQCSIDFIISVGLSADVSTLNFPVTLGGMLAKIDSKKDILAVGYSFTHPDYLPHLFFTHLQGITVAGLIVFTLLSIHKINKEFVKRNRL